MRCGPIRGRPHRDWWGLAAGHQSRGRAQGRQGVLRHRQRPAARARPRHRRFAGKHPWPPKCRRRSPHHYGGTIAPLIVRDMVVAGVAGADEGIRGFVAAFNAETGALVWRRWTVPRQGNQASKPGKGPSRSSGGSTWLTGSYDPSSDTLYWATGNPWPGGDDRNRPGDNLYTNCVLALRAATGEVKWHYQFTPTTSRTVTPPSPTCWWTVSIAASHPGCCSTPIAAAVLPCSIERTAPCCWPGPFSGAWIGPRASAPMDGRS